MTDEQRDALANIIDPDAWALYDDVKFNKLDNPKVKKLREELVKESRTKALEIINSGIMASTTWDRLEYFKAKARIQEATSRTGKCYGVKDVLDGYCKHDPKCRYWPDSATGPNSSCIT